MSDVSSERRRSALATLSTVGAAMAGLGVGILASTSLAAFAWPILAIGIVIHLFGMVGVRRVVSSTGYRPAKWEQAAYWLCWAAILLVGLFVLARMIQ